MSVALCAGDSRGAFGVAGRVIGIHDASITRRAGRPAQLQFCEEAKMWSNEVSRTAHSEAIRTGGAMTFALSEGRHALERFVLAVFLLSGLSAVASGQEILLAQANPSQAVPSNAPNSPPNVTPSGTPSATSNTTATCMAGCNRELFSCNGPCLSTSHGTTVIPSRTTAGITNSPGQCLQNCSTQMQTCQRNCALQ
jgi:hypothetical protein